MFLYLNNFGILNRFWFFVELGVDGLNVVLLTGSKTKKTCLVQNE